MKPANHLTEDQLDDALIGDLAADCAAHLAGCKECRLRLAEAEAPIASFNAVSLAWSERQSATMARPAPSAGAAWLPPAMWGATAAAVLAVGITVPIVRHLADTKDASTTASVHEAATPTLMAATGPVDNPVAAREEQIARDNQMLENIDRELTSASPYGQEYGLPASGNHTSARSTSAFVRN